MSNYKIATILIRFGIGIVFLYAGIDGFVHPSIWIGYFPGFIFDLGLAETLIPVFSILEILLALWLFSGVAVAYAGLVASILLIGIVISSPSQFVILFRDLGLALSALALYFLGSRVS